LSPPGGGEARRIFITIHSSAQSSFSRQSGIFYKKSLDLTRSHESKRVTQEKLDVNWDVIRQTITNPIVCGGGIVNSDFL
jgi:hypothetical protein